ncbi:MAG: sugar-binding protein [Acidobacteria bacterium]|jgi:ribose transport system substrate-binding protein|nr:sugar-binding protein [Acidobacteriota bacterium]
MKKLMVVAIVGVLAMSGVMACAGGAPEGPKKLRFALIPKSLDIPVFDYARIGGERAAAELGVEVIYRGPDKADELKQKEILESFITQKVDGIAISVLNAEFLTSTIDRAVEAGIPVVTWDSDAPKSKRLAFYGVDDFESGLLMGEETAKMMDGKGTVAFITSLGANNLQRRMDGAKESLAKYPGISIVETYDIKEDSTRCQELIATGTNRYPDLGAWISVGGWPVFSANALEPVPSTTKFVSFDTVEAALSLLRAGKVQVLLGQKYFGWGGESIRLLHGIINGNVPANPIIDSGVDVVTLENVDAYEAAWKATVGGQ